MKDYNDGQAKKFELLAVERSAWMSKAHELQDRVEALEARLRSVESVVNLKTNTIENLEAGYEKLRLRYISLCVIVRPLVQELPDGELKKTLRIKYDL